MPISDGAIRQTPESKLKSLLAAYDLPPQQQELQPLHSFIHRSSTPQHSSLLSKVGNSESVESDSMIQVSTQVDYSSRRFIHRVFRLESTESVAIANLTPQSTTGFREVRCFFRTANLAKPLVPRAHRERDPFFHPL